MADKRQDYIGWDECFMLEAWVASKRSKDPHTQVGACIASSTNRILSVGYNGAPMHFDDDKFPWSNHGDMKDTKYAYVVHAEANAILNYRGSLADMSGATIYVTLFPCNECAKMMAQTGISHVVYLSDQYDGTDGNVVSKQILDTCGITYREIQMTDTMKSIMASV